MTVWFLYARQPSRWVYHLMAAEWVGDRAISRCGIDAHDWQDQGADHRRLDSIYNEEDRCLYLVCADCLAFVKPNPHPPFT